MGRFARYISGQTNVCYRVVMANGEVWDTVAGEFSTSTTFANSLIEATKTAVTNAHRIEIPAEAHYRMEGMIEIFYLAKASVAATNTPDANPMFKGIRGGDIILHGIQ